MIRYDITFKELCRRVEAAAPGWLARSRTWVARARQAGRYIDGGPPWKEVKRVFNELQCSKCMYCERLLPPARISDVERDVEHYRPKKSVRPWKPGPRRGGSSPFSFLSESASKTGYYLLAHNVLNYGVSCKTCNSSLKGDRFPIAARRCLSADDPRGMAVEKPYLPYPIGHDVDKDDPEDLIGFIGVMPTVKSRDEHRRRRALVTIEFFHLDRDDLQRERAAALVELYEAFGDAKSHPDKGRRDRAPVKIRTLLSARAPHASCSRAFGALLERKDSRASQLYDLAFQLRYR